MKNLIMAAVLALGAGVTWGEGERPSCPVNWDKALVRGTTPNGKILYALGEEMAFSLILEGAEGTIPPDTYYLDWTRRGDDGVNDSGRAPLPVREPFVYRTKMDKPGFVVLEANVVTKDGKRVPKNHRWEKRVFFMGGAGAAPEKLRDGGKPADYGEFWENVMREIASVPMAAELKELPSKNAKVSVYALRIPCAGGFPVTGYVTIPKDRTRKYPIRASYRGASDECMPVETSGPEDAISSIINVNGYELGRDKAYYKEFFRSIATPGYGYGMSPEQNENRDTCYWKGVAMRAIRYVQWLKTRPEWNGRDLELNGGSQGDWQCYHAAARVPGVTRINANGSWGCDWTGQETHKRITAWFRPKFWRPAMAYFDPAFAVKHITCPVNISFSGLGDYVSPPSSLSVIYNNLKGPKKITYVQGSTHGWRPSGEQKFTIDGGFDEAVKPKADPAAAEALLMSKDVLYHLDATRADTLTLDAECRVLVWASCNGNGYAFTADPATAPQAKAKINGNVAVTFAAATGQVMAGAREIEHRTVFVVARPQEQRAFMGVWGPKDAEGGLRTTGNGKAWENVCFDGVYGGPDFNSHPSLMVDGSPHAHDAPCAPGEVHVIAMRHASDTKFWGATSKARFRPALGAYMSGHPYTGDIAEVIAFGRLLSDDECRNVSAALAIKWRNGLLDRLQAQLAAGKMRISVPKGRYSLRPSGGSVTYLQLVGLTDVMIDFNGSELIGEVKTSMLGFDACTNVTVRNVIIDYASLPFTQAVIEKTDADGTWDVRVIDGYPCPDEKEVGNAQAIWPVQAYDKDTLELKNPLRFRNGIAISKTGPRTYRISGGYNRVGDVGDIAVWSIREMDRPVRRGAVCAENCKSCFCENVIVYSTPHGCAYVEGGADGNIYRNCKVVRRPPESDLVKRGMRRLRSGNHDAFNSRCSYKGPTLENCEFKYHCDDCVNISGYYAFVTEQKGRTIRIAPFCSDLRISPGDSCQLMTYEGRCPPDATALTIVPDGETTAEERQLLKDLNLWESIGETVRKTFKVELDREVTLHPGSVIISNRRMGNGFVIRNCDMGHNRARGLLIKASDGLIESNRLTRTECTGMEISPEYEWMEGGCSRNLVIRGNVLTGNGGGISLSGNNGARKPLPVGAHSNVAIVGNTIRGSAHGITVVGCKGLDLRDNAFELTDAKVRPIKLVNTAKVDEF